jgi:hypothetical protein
MNALVEQLMMLRGATCHLADVALHEARSMTREELRAARVHFRDITSDLSKTGDALWEFEPDGPPMLTDREAKNLVRIVLEPQDHFFAKGFGDELERSAS